MSGTNFEHLIESPKQIIKLPVRNLAELIFKRLDFRDEQADVIRSHVGNHYLCISLQHFRFIILELYEQVAASGLKKGDTVLLASVPGNNECFVALLFAALASFGVRVLLPMFTEGTELERWLELADCKAIIYPESEILALEHHEKEKALIRQIRKVAQEQGLLLFDSIADFHLPELVTEPTRICSKNSERFIEEIMNRSSPDDETLIITTSGSSGKSKLVVYDQSAFLRSCASWQSAGFFEPERFGGRGFTPLFTHTMGIRSFINALWCGQPVCLLNTEWFAEKPETIRYFLLQMKPEHLTGGPAAFRLLLEMMRHFPDLKVELPRHMKTLISSGAPLRPEVVAEIESVFNLPVYNAYGTTETQQVLNALLLPESGEDARASLGAPLPGVTVGLEPFAGEDLYRMHIRSPFGCKRILGTDQHECSQSGFFNTGDIVRFKEGLLFYVGRESQDFLKDGFGVKVPLPFVRRYYKEVLRECEYLEFFPLLGEPGLAAIFFPKKRQAPEEVRPYFTRLLEKVNDRLFNDLDPFVYRHHIIRRFAIVNEDVPRTAKGSVAHQQIRTIYRDLIARLTGTFPDRNVAEIVKSREDVSDPFTDHANPYVGGMLHELKMDYRYHRANKDSLFTYKGQQEIEILDMTGGYGTNLLGHNHPEVISAVMDFLQRGKVCLSNQASIQETAGHLAEKINLLVGERTGKRFVVTFASSGAETVEMALHHACLEWRERLKKFREKQFQLHGGRAGALLKEVWEQNQQAIENCRLQVIVSKYGFHGHSSSARSLLKPSEKRRAFSNLLSLQPIYVDDRDANWREKLETDQEQATLELRQVVATNGKYRVETVRFSTIIAAIFESVRGEGGIRRANPEVLRYFSQQEFPLIMDEIQCGLGRTGTFLASDGVNADYYLFGKALGGGIEKIAAVLINASRYQTEFGKYYSSTFANGELAAHTALRALEIIVNDNIPEKAKERGEVLRRRLEAIRRACPDVIAEISGSGLMQGIHFVDFSRDENFILRTLARNDLCGYFYSSYLLNRHQVRILPSLSAANTLRVQPSAYISDAEIDLFCRALEDLAKNIHERNLYHLCRHFMDGDDFIDNRNAKPKYGHLYTGLEPPAPGSVPVTFIGHFAYPVEEMRALEKGFVQASETGLRILFRRVQNLLEMKPVTVFQKNIFEGQVHFTFMIIPLDSAVLERLHREGERQKIVSKIQQAVNLAVASGSRIISLGGYTSILTNNGMAIAAPAGVKVITGNTLTAASGVRRVFQTMKKRPFFRKKNVAAIVGIPGNIGSVLAELFAQRDDLFSEIILVGRSNAVLKHYVESLRKDVAIPAQMTIRTSTDLRCLRRCDVIVVTTNSSDPIIFRHHIRPFGEVLIADNSVPAAVADEVKGLPNVISLPFSSYVQFPADPDFLISTYTPRGTAFCCAAEAVLCALEPVNLPLKGKITVEAVQLLDTLAEKYGLFEKLGGIRTFRVGKLS